MKLFLHFIFFLVIFFSFCSFSDFYLVLITLLEIHFYIRVSFPFDSFHFSEIKPSEPAYFSLLLYVYILGAWSVNDLSLSMDFFLHLVNFLYLFYFFSFITFALFLFLCSKQAISFTLIKSST